MIEWSAVTAVLAIIGFVHWVLFNLLKAQFITKAEFKEHQTGCFTQVCSQINDLRGDLKEYRIDAEQKRDDAREKFTDQLNQIRVFMARVDQKIQDDRWSDNK